ACRNLVQSPACLLCQAGLSDRARALIRLRYQESASPPALRPRTFSVNAIASTSPSRLIPVSNPHCSAISTRSSVARLPDAPGAKGHPPIPPALESKRRTPDSSATHALATPIPRVL